MPSVSVLTCTDDLSNLSNQAERWDFSKNLETPFKFGIEGSRFPTNILARSCLIGSKVPGFDRNEKIESSTESQIRLCSRPSLLSLACPLMESRGPINQLFLARKRSVSRAKNKRQSNHHRIRCPCHNSRGGFLGGLSTRITTVFLREQKITGAAKEQKNPDFGGSEENNERVLCLPLSFLPSQRARDLPRPRPRPEGRSNRSWILPRFPSPHQSW